MIRSFYQECKSKLTHWRSGERFSQNPHILYSKHIYILPTTFGYLYGVILLSILIGAINYQLNAAYFFVFLLMSIGLVTMWQTHQNLKGISIQCLPIDDVEQGNPARLKLYISMQRQDRYNLTLTPLKNKSYTIEHASMRGETTIIPLATPVRGKHTLPPVKIVTRYPLRLFGAWSTLYFNQAYYVYPAAQSPGFWPESVSQLNERHASFHSRGDEDLYALKPIENPWAQTAKIAWKISARGQGWYLKTMTSPAGEHWLFRLNDLADTDIETCLQQLSYWIQTAEAQNQLYALELKDVPTEFSNGEAHMKHCLRLLAVF